MNIYAEDLGLENTNFVNSSGWPDENHYSTVKDIVDLLTEERKISKKEVYNYCLSLKKWN